MQNGKRTKADIVEKIFQTIPLGKKDIHQVIDALFEEMKAALGEDKILQLRGLGTFMLRTRKKQESARNPKTGETVEVNAHGVVVFRPGKELKEATRALRNN